MRLAAIATTCLFLMQACGGDPAGTVPAAAVVPPPVIVPVNSTPTTLTAPDQAAAVNVTVTLPAGAPQTLDTLTLNNSIGAVSAGSAGTFALPVFAGGPQYADVLDKSGTVVALGFISTTATTVDATSTAKLLIYFAAGFYDLPMPYRADIVDQVSAVAGFGDVVTAVSNAIVAGGVGSPTGGPLVTAALQTFVAALYAPSNAAPAAVVVKTLRRHIKEVRVQPSGLQSGITVVNDFPNGVHFMNKYRRLATAYIDEVSFTDSQGVVTPKPVTDVVDPVQVPNTSGVGTVTSTAVDAARVLAGAAGDYNPVSTASVPLGLEDGSAKTTYNVTVVGPAVHIGDVVMTDEQSTQQRKLVLQQLLQNYIIPITTSVILPINASQIDAYFNFISANGVIADFINNLGLYAPQIVDLMNQGNVADALTAAFNALAQMNELQAALLQIVYNVIDYAKGAGAAQAAGQRAQTLLLFLNVVSGVLVSYDVGVLTTQLALSNRADTFTVDVIASKVNLNPATATIPTTASQVYTANVPSLADSGQTAVYTWSNTGTNGHLTDGLAGHTDNFESSKNTVTYTPNSDGNGNDTITVVANLIDGTNRPEIGTASATVTVQNANVPVGVSPQDPQVLPGTVQNFTIKSSTGAAFASGTTFKWVLTRGFDLFGDPRDICCSGGGTIGNPVTVPASNGHAIGTSLTVTTSAPSIGFAANPFGPEAAGPDFAWVDEMVLTVSVLNSAGSVLETATTNIQTQIPRDILLP